MLDVTEDDLIPESDSPPTIESGLTELTRLTSEYGGYEAEAAALDELVRESEELGLYQAWKLAEETEVTSEIPVAYLRHLIESSRPPKE